MARPNILLITCHDLGDFLGCYGHPVATPNLNSLADEGVLLHNHFSTGTVCSPSRGALMTGCYPHTNGLMGLVHRGWELDVDKCPHLVSMLRDAGYQTHLMGFQHEHRDPAKLGYQHKHKAQSDCGVHLTPLVEKWLTSDAAKQGPWFANVGFFEVHRFGASPSHFRHDSYSADANAKVEVPAWLPDIPEVRGELVEFYAAIRYLDQCVGRILAALEDEDLARNTVVIFTTDHGASFIHAKATLYEGGNKVAMMMRAPGLLPEGRVVEGLTSHIDFTPTMLDLLDLPPREGMTGGSFVDVLKGARDSYRDSVFAERNTTNSFVPSRMVRTERYRYIRNGLQMCVLDFQIPEVEGCAGGGFRGCRGYFDFYDRRRVLEELYDLQSDPGERNNLVFDASHTATLDDMRKRLDAHLIATDDAFRHFRNELLMPADGYVNR
jgi:arylsulfatase A-like enzyme